jgi:hypothetical protein
MKKFLIPFILLLSLHQPVNALPITLQRQNNEVSILENKSNETWSIIYIARLPKKVGPLDFPVSIVDGDVGHAFIGILKYRSGKLYEYHSIGKWLNTGATIDNPYDLDDLKKVIENKQSKLLSYEEVKIEDWQILNLKEVIEKENGYDLINSNCTDFLIRVMNVQLRTLNYKTGETGNPVLLFRRFHNTRIKL